MKEDQKGRRKMVRNVGREKERERERGREREESGPGSLIAISVLRLGME